MSDENTNTPKGPQGTEGQDEGNVPWDVGEREYLPLYEPHPKSWRTHPKKKMLMTPLLVFFGGIFAYAVPTLVAGFFHLMFFNPPVSNEWSPLKTSAVEGRHVFASNGCIYCHSGYTRPQDVRVNLFYLYVRRSLPGDFATSDDRPNLFGTARIGPDLSQESGFHPDDWHRAHYADPRFVDPDSIMPDFNIFSDKQLEDLIQFMQMRAGKSGLIRYAGHIYMKKLFKVSNNNPDPPTGFKALKKTLADVALEASNAPSPPNGTYKGLSWPDPINLAYVDRGYWLMDNPLPITQDNLVAGRFIFQQRCIGCHGRGGSAVSHACGFMSPSPIDFTSPDDASSGSDTGPGTLYYRVLRGIDGSAMENFGTRLRVEDIWKVIMFLKTIPNGGLDPKKLPTPDMYIEWKPPPDLLSYMNTHPVAGNKSFTGTPTTDPFMLQAQRDLAGLGATETIPLPGYGPVSFQTARRDIKKIYDDLFEQAWKDYKARGGSPVPPESQKNALPDLSKELR